MDSVRIAEVLRREREALIARVHEHLRLSGTPLRTTCQNRAMLAHRSSWFLDKISCLLTANGWTVVGRTDNGADAVGAAVAEQPDLLLVEDTLAMVPGVQVVRDVRKYCPQTVVTAHVTYDDRIGAMVTAGACEVFTRRMPPPEVAGRLLQLFHVEQPHALRPAHAAMPAAFRTVDRRGAERADLLPRTESRHERVLAGR